MNPDPQVHQLKNEPVMENIELSYDNLFELVEFFVKGGLDKGFNNAKRITRKKLIDYLNYINFSEGEIIVVFEHSKYHEIVTRQVKPVPCQGEVVSALWNSPADFSESMRDYQVHCFLIEKKREIILAQCQKVEIDPQGITLTVPEFGFELFLRKANRYPGRDIRVQLIQGGILFSGRLAVFSVKSFLVEIFSGDGISLKWINTECPVQIIFQEEGKIFYSRECRIVKQKGNLSSSILVLQPSQEPMSRFKKREFRAPRQTLHPSPGIYFSHPLINQVVKLNICDLSTSGFSVEEEEESSTLLPGMIIPEIRMELASTTSLSLKAQVIYKNKIDDHIVKSGFTILNMSNGDYIKLTNLVNKSLNNNLDICGTLELDSLWQLFFQSGFIYPQKYHYIQQNKEDFKKIYERIYNHPTEIERHITYQERGTILGHISMLHVYETTWMLHHFAATPNSRHKRVALTLLQQIERYIIDSHYLESSQMDNIICYFRPENKFPNLVFGGAARTLKDPRICSLDRFAYLSYPMFLGCKEGGLPEPWEITPCHPEDLEELVHYYRHTSGGQMIQALDLSPENLGRERLTQKYQRVGFKRERRLLSIKKKDKVKAIVSLIKTDMGLNLSELANCLSVFVLEPENFPFEIFMRSLAQLSVYDERPMIPILLYPVQYAERHSISYERQYDLWVFGVDNSDYYFNYINKIFSRLLS
jgi:Acetyltransferase (GNAT) family